MNPPAYLVHSLLADKGYITTMEDCFSSKAINAQPSLLALPFSISHALLPNKLYTMFKPVTHSSDGGIENAQQFFNYKFTEYDQETREWEDYLINKLTIDGLLTKGIDPAEETSIFLKELKEDISQSKYYKYAPHSHPLLYDVLANLELYSSNIQFTVDGDLRLDVGQVITVDEQGNGGVKREQFDGKWLISKIRHSFRNKQYKADIVCSRRFHRRHEKLEE